MHPQVKMVTTLGNMTLELDAVKAPTTVLNFVRYAESGLYDGTVFHRVVKDSLIQGGGYTADMEPKPVTRPPAVPDTWVNELENKRGTIAMIRGGDKAAPTSAQFFINLIDNSEMDTLASTGACAVFGKVVEGMDTLERIHNTPVGPHPKYAAGRSAVVPTEPVIVKSVRLTTPFAVEKARAAALQANTAQVDRLGTLIADLEKKTGNKMVTTESGLRYVDSLVGPGPSPALDGTIEFHYRGTLLDGTEFESTYSGEPRVSQLEKLIAGLREGISTMKEGGHRTLIVPPELAFGPYGVPNKDPEAPYKIPPNATVVFEIQLISVK